MSEKRIQGLYYMGTEGHQYARLLVRVLLCRELRTTKRRNISIEKKKE
ncbi:MAG: hypothetical protein NWE97_00210 [Candidatus Bathyarchaeota archaeon]|nr:hypothetical protein [Candidatus Bathyarchaeota archaeon]